jgi:hypothetical protein
LAEPRQLFPFGAGQPRPTVRAVGTGALHPVAHRRLGQVHVARHGADGLAVVEHEANYASFELVSELAPWAPLW